MLISDDLQIEGLATWIHSTLIVRIAAIAAAIILPVIKNQLEARAA